MRNTTLSSFSFKFLTAMAIIAVALVGLPVRPAYAATCTSNGTGTLWSSAAHWTGCGGLVPQAGDTVIIATNTTIDTNTNSLASLTIDAGQTLTIGNSNANRTVTITGNVTVNGTFTSAGNGGNVLNIGGNLTNNNVFDMNTAGDADVTFNGAANQTISGTGGTTEFNSLTLSNTNGLTLNKDITVTATLAFTNGKITTGANAVILPVTATVSGVNTARYVVGNVQRAFTGASTSFTFPIGDTTSYAPVLLAFGTVGTNGNVTASVTNSACGSPGINQTRNVNHCWILTNGGTGFTNYSATFNFVGVGTDADAGSNTANFIVGKNDAGTWTYPTVGTRTATSTQATGMTSMSSFEAGEQATNLQPTVSTPIADVNVLEDAANTVFSLYSNFADTEDTDAQLNFTITGNTNPGLFTSVDSSDPTNFTLDYAPDANGTADITIRATDTGGLFVEDTFTATVTAVNDAPSFAMGGNQSAFEDAGAQTVVGWAMFISAGPANEAGQTLTFSVTNDNNALFSAQPSIAANGTLTYTPAANANGSATVTVESLQDNGGTANGGVDTFTPVSNTFTITITAVNDAPSFTGFNPLASDEDAGPQTTAVVSFSSMGPVNESSQSTLAYIVTNSTCGTLLSAGPTVDTSAQLSYTAAADQSGTCTFDLQLQDNGGTANGGVDTSPAQNITITVNGVDDASVAADDTATVNEDSSATSINVRGNDTDIDSAVELIQSVTQPANGVVVNNGTDLSYQPNANYCNDGTPTDDFTYTLTGGSTATVAMTVVCLPDPPTITSAPPLGGTVGFIYSHTFTATGDATITYSVTAGALPNGLTLSSSGIISGTPTAGGTFNGTVTATNGVNPDDTQAFSITITPPAISVSPTTLPNGTVATAYSQTITASGGTAPYSFAITAGALPAGLTLSSGGALSGTPTAGGAFNFTVTATDLSGGTGPYTGSRAYTLTIDAPTITLSPLTLPNGTLTFAYSQTVTAAGGIAPYSFAVTAGTLPTGLSLSSGGLLSGTPTAVGTFNFTVTATDSSTGTGPFTGSQTYSVTINSNTTVAINQAAGQADPTSLSPIVFDVVFSSSVTGFDGSDVNLGASTAGGTLIASVSGSGASYTVNVTGMTTAGNVIATIPAGAAQDSVTSLPTAASTSTDNTVMYDPSVPTVSASSPANSASVSTGLTQLTVTFSEDVKNDGSAGAANNIANYRLVEDGANSAFDTLTCAGGVVADDTAVGISAAAYTNNGGSGPFVATLTTSPLGAGSYRLYVCGTTSIEDLNGTELNGGVSDAQVNFIVTAPSGGGGGTGGGGSTAAAALTNTLLPATGFPMNQVTSLPVQPMDKVYSSTDMWLEIPKLDVKMSIVGVPSTKGQWDVTWLDKDAGWLNGSAYPTWKGNSVITGHVWDALNKPGPFAKLKDLKYGDQIKIHAFGSVYVYEIRSTESISPSNSTKVFKHEEKSWLTLITCEDYKELTNTYLSRRMLRAVLISVSAEK